ncbi:MAG TPA: OmpA family protein [Polyangiaceae bacterium]
MRLAHAVMRRICGIAMLGLVACSQGPVMRGQIAGLSKIAAQAERNGAMRCAPRELAMAKAHLKFAELELDQGFTSRAGAHLAVAEPNAHAAYDLSPPETCAERGLVTTAEEPDTDGDGIVDSRDMCVLEPEDKDGYLDDDGCPEPDNDLDGILDKVDKCPNEPEDPDGFDDQDGCPDPDNDKDTVADLDDICPNEPGPPDGERPGCPRKPALVIVTDKEIKITQQIHFEFDKAVIRPESFPILDAVAEVLQKNPNMRIEVQGHTDNKGSAAYNLKLSDRRAASVRKYLTGKGIAADRLASHGYGLTRPLVPNDTEQNRALNRRVQFIRTEGGQAAPP